VTTRTLVLLRHAKAANPPAVADIDRPLTARGHADAAAAGAWLSHRGFVPDLVVCSPSRRTRETWHGVALALTSAPDVRYDDEVYAASARDLLDLVCSVDDATVTVLMVGHNPGISQLSTLLGDTGDTGDTGDAEDLRTAGAAVHRFDGHWAECTQGSANLVTTHTARA
jgi:phosphohistidine phosphatase